jgi:hypothetical protein
VQQLIEGVEIARITGSQPSEHHRLASIDHRTKLTGPAPRATRPAAGQHDDFQHGLGLRRSVPCGGQQRSGWQRRAFNARQEDATERPN